MANEIGNRFEAVVMGTSTGGLKALEVLLRALPADYPLPIIIVQHRSRKSDEFLQTYFNDLCALHVVEAEEKTKLCQGVVYLAPPDYHLQVEMDRTLSLSVDAPVQWSRPSVDVLFETAAEAFRDKLVGVIMTGANTDGSQGLSTIKQYGGLAVVQSPESATASEMPMAALKATDVDYVLSLEDIGRLVAGLKGP